MKVRNSKETRKEMPKYPKLEKPQEQHQYHTKKKKKKSRQKQKQEQRFKESREFGAGLLPD